MCKFCEIGETGIGEKQFPYIGLILALTHNNELLINHLGENFTVPIKFCPLCGKPLTEEVTVREELLRACYDLLNKQVESPYVLNLLDELVPCGDTECDGTCIMEDIAWELNIEDE